MIRQGSRYEKVEVYNFIDETRGIIPTLHRRRIVKLTPDSEVIRYQIKQGDTLDGLAYEYLGDSSLWWFLLDINPEYLSPFDIKVGDILLIPTRTSYRRAVETYGL